MAELIALIDLDGTLADFDKAMDFELKCMRAPDESGAPGPHIKARRHIIERNPEFWRNLPRFELGFDILTELRNQCFTCHILSKGPSSIPSAWTEKVKWCQDNVPDTPIILCGDKWLVYGRILVDDWPDYYLPWLHRRPRGIVISPAQRWNKDVTHNRVIRYTGNNFGEVREAIQAVKEDVIAGHNLRQVREAIEKQGAR